MKRFFIILIAALTGIALVAYFYNKKEKSLANTNEEEEQNI
jgi:hypothetical protein